MFVSVIIPTYNREGMLKEAIDSVFLQDYPEKELIVVDDGSTDATESLCRSYGDRLRYLHTENRGVSHARNLGIRESKGDLVAFLDSDDVWLPEKLSVQINYLNKHPEIHICQTEEVWIRDGKRVNPRLVHKKHSGWIFDECIPLCIVSPSAVMIRRSVFEDVGLFDEEMPACEDYDLWLRASLKYQIMTLPEPLIEKRGGHSDQLSRHPLLDRWRIYALQKMLSLDLESPEKRLLITDDICRRAKIVATGAMKRQNHDLARQYFQLAEQYA